MKKSVSKRSRNNGLKRKNTRLKRKNTRSKRRNTISKKNKKNKKLIGGVIGKISDDTTLTLTYNLNSHPPYSNLRDAVEAKLRQSGQYEISSESNKLPLDKLPLNDKDDALVLVGSQFKVEKTGEKYSVTVVGNFGESESKKGDNSKKILRSIKLANVPEEKLEDLLIGTLHGINLSEGESNKDPEFLKNKVCEHLLMFFNKFTKSCSNSLEIEILKALGYIKNMTIEDLSKQAIKISEKLKKEDTSINLYSLIKQFLCLEPIQFKKSGGGLRVFLTPFEFVGCIFFGVLCGLENVTGIIDHVEDTIFNSCKHFIAAQLLINKDFKFTKKNNNTE